MTPTDPAGAVQRYVMDMDDHSGDVYMAEATARDAHTTQYVLATDYDALRQQLAEMWGALERIDEAASGGNPNFRFIREIAVAALTDQPSTERKEATMPSGARMSVMAGTAPAQTPQTQGKCAWCDDGRIEVSAGLGTQTVDCPHCEEERTARAPAADTP